MLIKFKTFINAPLKYNPIIVEALNNSQKKIVDKWKRDPSALEATDHYFGKGNDVLHHQLKDTQDKSEIHKAIEHHLGQSIEPEHYKAGLVKDQHGRDVKIGKMLNKTKAPLNIIRGFENDSTRQGKKYTGLSVKISRHPHDVAGQTSSGQSWENESCKNFKDGVMREILPGEVKHGTVVGYLHNHEGKEIARATLQPYQNEHAQTKMYAVNSHYGIDHQGFKDHMKQVAKDLSSKHTEGSPIYKIHPYVYDDSNGEHEWLLHPSATKKQLNDHIEKNPNDIIHVLNSPHVTSEHIHNAIVGRGVAGKHVGSLLYHPKAKAKTVNHILDNTSHYSPLSVGHAIEHPKADSEKIHNIARGNDTYSNMALVSPKITDNELLHKGVSSPKTLIRRSVANNPHLTHEHFNKLVADKDHEVKANLARNPSLPSEHITGMLLHTPDKSSQDAQISRHILYHNKFTPEHHQDIVNNITNDKYHVEPRDMLSHPMTKSHHLRQMINDINQKQSIPIHLERLRKDAEYKLNTEDK